MVQTREHSKTWGSIAVIGGLLVVALLGALVFALAQPHATGELVAKVTQDGEVVAMLPLSQDAREVFVCADGVNTVVVQDGSVHIEDADCPGGDCMKQGTIDAAGCLLVCLPHKLIVEIEPGDSPGQVVPSVYTGEEAVGQEDAAGIDVVAR